MQALINLTYRITLILLIATSTFQQHLASNLFVSDQIILWGGNNVVQYQQSATLYSFSSTFKDPPGQITKIFPIFNGFYFLNQNRISFSVTSILNSFATGAYTITFTPKNSLIFYQVAFTIVGMTIASTGLLEIERYYLTPTNISNTSRSAVVSQQTFTLTAGSTFADSSFQIRAFLSFFDSYQSSGFAGVSISPIGSYVTGSLQFDVNVTVPSGSELYLCSIVTILLDKKSVFIHNAEYAAIGLQVSQNFSASPDIALNSQTSTKFSNPSIYGPIMSRNCSIGFYEVFVSTHFSIKSIIYYEDSSSGAMNVMSSIGGGGAKGVYQTLCIVDCFPNAYYNSTLQKCDSCSIYIRDCESCINDSYCTNCGVMGFFDYINKRCSCMFGIRVMGGCTSIANCLSIDKYGLCRQCQIGFTLSTNQRQCSCPTGYFLAGWACTNVAGCITAFVHKNQSKCFACNTSLHYVVDGKGGCTCGPGYTSFNGVCRTVCGNGQLFGLQQCDDGNHVQGDGCSALCQIQKSYVCNTTIDGQSVCSYKTQFAQINLIQLYRDTDQNAGYFIFTVQPAISNLNKMDFASSINISCASNVSSPIIDYNNGILSIKVYFLDNIENQKMNITLKFNQTIIIHKPISSVFNIKSLNSPMNIFTKFPQYDFINLYLKILSIFAVIIFMVGCYTQKMIGVQTIHVFQFVYFTNIYEIAYSDLFISSIHSLRYTSNYPDIFYDQMTGIREGDIFQSLMFAFTFVANYYIIGTVTLLVIFLFIVFFLKKLYKRNRLFQAQDDSRLDLSRESQQKLESEYAIISQIIYSICFFPITVAYYLQCFFAVEAQLYRKNDIKSHLTLLTNSILAIMFICMDSFTIFRQIFFNFKQTSKSVYYNVENRYIALYIANLLFNIIFFNFSDRIQYDLTIMASYNTLYLLTILIYRPYKHHLHNFHIVYNQIIYVLWVIVLIYQDRAAEKLTDNQKYIVLTTLVSALSLSLVISLIRILVELIQNGSQIKKIKKYYDHKHEVSISLKRRSQRRIKNILRTDIKSMNSYFVEEQLKQIIQTNRQQINTQRKALGLNNLYEPSNYKQQTSKRREEIREQIRINEQQVQKFEVMLSSNQKSKKQGQIFEIKQRLRQNLLRYKQKKKQTQRQKGLLNEQQQY